MATVPGSGPPSLSTTFALLTPGNSATRRMFTVLTSAGTRQQPGDGDAAGVVGEAEHCLAILPVIE